MNMIRAATAGTHPAFVQMIRELILERIDSTTPRRSIGVFGPRNDVCHFDCCTLSEPPA
jgi:ferrochelatase